MAETVSGSTAVMTITPRFLPPHPTLTQKQLIQCHLPHSHTYLKCPRMNMAVIKSHSTDEMKTVRRQRQKWGGGTEGGQEMGLEATFPPARSAYDTNYFSFLFLRRATTISPRWKVLHAEFDCFAGAISVDRGGDPVGGVSTTKKNNKYPISCNHKCTLLLIQKERMQA